MQEISIIVRWARAVMIRMLASELLFFVGVVLLGVAAMPHSVLARPGTPVDVKLSVEDHRRIYFGFRNVAKEPVVFDFDLSINGHTADLQTAYSKNWFLNCGSPEEPTEPVCKKVIFHIPSDPFIYVGQVLSVYSTRMPPNSRICLRVIAREWNNGNPQSGLVSDQWSAWACGTTKPLPSPPGPPAAPQVKYFNALPERGLPSQVQLVGYYPPLRCTNVLAKWTYWSTVDKWVNGQWQKIEPAAWCMSRQWNFTESNVPPPAPTNLLRYRVCVANDGGARCSPAAQAYSDAAVVGAKAFMKRPSGPPPNIGKVVPQH